jgi:hypothetical protein
MKKKKSSGFRVAPIQYFDAIPITDPAEQAALDRRCEEAQKRLDREALKKMKSRKRR